MIFTDNNSTMWKFIWVNNCFIYRILPYLCKNIRGGHDRMVVGFTTTCAISAYHHWSCEFEPRSWWGVLYTELCDKFCQWPATGRWFSLGTLVSSTNKTDCHDITEIFNWYLCVSAKHAALRSKNKESESE